jgi:hypothetical protein
MKTPHLLASFAVAAVASAADLKDPADVAREWNDAATNPPSFVDETGLKITSPKSPARNFSHPHPKVAEPNWAPIPRDRIYDTPNYTVPEVLPDNMPAGTLMRKFGGTSYYVMPAVPAREK